MALSRTVTSSLRSADMLRRCRSPGAGWSACGRKATLGPGAHRMAVGAIVGILVRSVGLLGYCTPLPAPDGDGGTAPEATGASGVSMRLDDLVERITYTIGDRFEAPLSNLDTATTRGLEAQSSMYRVDFGLIPVWIRPESKWRAWMFVSIERLCTK